MDITIKIEAPELALSINNLAVALSKQKPVSEMKVTAPAQALYQQPVAPIPQPVQEIPVYQQPPVQPTAPIQQTPAPVQPMYQQPPIQPVATAPTVVPTQAQTYTMEHLAVAAQQLMDAGHIAKLQQLLQSFGAPSMMQLPKEQYGAFATQLRALGAKI